MRIAVIFLALLAAGCSTDPQKRVARDAATAMTGSPWTLTAAASLTIEGRGTVTDGGTPTELQWFQQVINLKAGPGLRREARAGAPLVETPLAASERLHHPLGFLAAAFSRNPRLSRTRTEGNLEAVDLTADGTTYSLFIDGASKLPVKITSAGRETSFDHYVDIHGYRLPGRITVRQGSATARTMTLTRQFASEEPVAFPPVQVAGGAN